MKKPDVYVVRYIAKHWMHKPDPNGFGKCSIAYTSYDEAQQKACKLQAKGCSVLIEKV